MDNKCPNCGNLCSEFDAFCPKCGYKLHDTKSSSDSDFDILKKAALNNANKYYEDNKNKRTFNSEFFNPSASPKNESLAFNLALFFFIIVLILSLISYFSIENHKLKKEELNFKNLINNPSQIPELKEPVDDVDLTRNFSSVTNFLRLYLKFSDDSIEKKQQVFISYLNEAEKLPHLTNESLIRDDFNVCYSIDSKRRADLCCEKFSRDFKTFGITAFSDKDTVYLYPNYKFINKTFSRYFS